MVWPCREDGPGLMGVVERCSSHGGTLGGGFLDKGSWDR